MTCCDKVSGAREEEIKRVSFIYSPNLSEQGMEFEGVLFFKFPGSLADKTQSRGMVRGRGAWVLTRGRS